MSDKLMFIEVRGKQKEWCFPFYGDPKYIDEWRADGLNVNFIENSIPSWWMELGLSASSWCFWQDVFNFRNPWRK